MNTQLPTSQGEFQSALSHSTWLNWSADRIFLLLAPLFYAAFALLTPPFQSPDEQQHLFRAWQLSEMHLIGERRPSGAGGVLPLSLGAAALPEIGTLDPHAARSVVSRAAEAMFSRNTPAALQPVQFYDFRGSVIYSPAGYAPQVLAIWGGKSLGLSIEAIVRIGRLLNGALTIFLIYFAIRLSPIGALPMLWVGLLPMSASASASFGQDGIVIGGACLLTALGMRVLFNGRWKRSELLTSAGLVTVLALAKIFYFPLAFISAAPGPIGPLWKRLLPAVLTCVAAVLLTAVWLHAVVDITLLPRDDIPPPLERLSSWVHDPAVPLRLLERTFIWNGPYIVGTLFKFGWLSIGPVRSAEFICLLALLVTLIAGDAAADRIKWQTRLWLLSIASSIVLLVTFGLYLYSRPASDDWVQGFQARYLIPIAPAMLIGILPKRTSPPAYAWTLALLMLSGNLLSLRAIFDAFYV